MEVLNQDLARLYPLYPFLVLGCMVVPRAALRQECGEEASCFGINVLASCRRYAAEPDFLSFLS